MDIREIEKEIDVFHKNHDAFKYSRATTILNLLRSFEDGCRLLGPAEMAMNRSPEMMEMNNRYFLDAIDTAVKWAYCECVDDGTIDFVCDDRYLIFSFLLLYYAKPYSDICSAYISYSRGYFSASITNKNVLFTVNKPIPKILNADYSVEIQNKYNRDKTELIKTTSEFKSIREELISVITTVDGHVNYTITPDIWIKTKKVLQLQYDSTKEIPGEWIIDGFSLNEYCNVWVALATWMMIHSLSCLFSGLSGAGLDDVVLTKTIDEIVQFVLNKTEVPEAVIRKIINLLVFDWSIKNNDIVYQPIIKLTSELYALSPNLLLNSNPERNLISIIHKYQNKTEYSSFTNKRESLMAKLIVGEINLDRLHTKTNVNMPAPLPDIDLLIYDSTNNALLLCELKWLNPADSTSEVYARQDDIDKGVKQSEDTLKYAKYNPKDCVSRAFDKNIIGNIDWTSITIGACVISKNIIRTTLDTIPVINIGQFAELCKDCNFNLEVVIKALEQRHYLPRLPDKYIETNHQIEYAGYIFTLPVIEYSLEVCIDKAERNDPCPCGKVNPLSGKPMKYKKCCGKNL